MHRSVVLPVSTLAAFLLALLLPTAESLPDAGAAAFLVRHFEQRAAALLAGQVGPELLAEVDRTTAAGRWLLAHEQQKVAHVHAWARARGYVLAGQRTEVKVLRLRTDGQTARASVLLRIALGYKPRDARGGPTDWMGVGTSHVVHLARAGDSWLVRRDFALDALYEEGPPPGAAAGGLGHSVPVTAAAPEGPAGDAAGPARRFDRAAAAGYAYTYCGIAFGCGNGHRYNRQYQDYTGLGGDCANFASQVLVAGGLRPGGAWRYDARSRSASAAWINAGRLVRHLLYSGKARLVARGSFARVAAAAGGPGLPRLAPGDMIGYEQDGDIVHVSVVVGTDSAGYTVVNSHTADRHHVPWDLGWGENTRFWLLHIRD